MIACLEDCVSHLDRGFGLVEHVFESLDLGVGDDGRGLLSRVGQELVDEGVEGDFPDVFLFRMDEDDHGDDYPVDLFLAVAPLMDL